MKFFINSRDYFSDNSYILLIFEYYARIIISIVIISPNMVMFLNRLFNYGNTVGETTADL